MLISVTQHSKATSGSTVTTIDNGSYTIVGLVESVANIKEKGTEKAVPFYSVVLGLLDANHKVVDLVKAYKNDFTDLVGKIDVDKLDRMVNSGDAVATIKKIYIDNAGSNVDLIWLNKILPAFNGRVFVTSAKWFNARRRDGAIANMCVYTHTFVQATADLTNVDSLALAYSWKLYRPNPDGYAYSELPYNTLHG